MADPLVTLQQLALWSQRDLSEVEADPWAQEIVQELSDYARFLGGHENWVRELGDGVTTVTAPYDVKRAVLMAARRTYVNPDSEVQSHFGPVGSRILEEAALAGAFTEAEVAVIQGHNPGGSPNGLWVQRTVRGEDPLAVDEVLYVDDNMQVGMDSSKNAYPSWSVPMFNPDDPGGQG